MAVDLTQDATLDNPTVLTLPIQDDGTVAIKLADLQALAPQLTPVIDPTSGDWVVGGQSTLVKATGSQITIDDLTKHWFIDGQDTGVPAVGQDGEQGPAGRDALTFSLDTPVLGDQVAVENVATEDGQVRLKFTLPTPNNGEDGKDGVTPQIVIGNVTTGDVPAVTDNLDESTQTHTLDFVLPRTDLSGYAQTTDLAQQLAQKVDTQKLVEYYDAQSVDKMLALKADVQSVANVANKDDVQQLKNTNEVLTNRVDELTAKVADLTTRLVATEQKQATK